MKMVIPYYLSEKLHALATNFPSPCDRSHSGAVYQISEHECVCAMTINTVYRSAAPLKP